MNSLSRSGCVFRDDRGPVRRTARGARRRRLLLPADVLRVECRDFALRHREMITAAAAQLTPGYARRPHFQELDGQLAEMAGAVRGAHELRQMTRRLGAIEQEARAWGGSLLDGASRHERRFMAYPLAHLLYDSRRLQESLQATAGAEQAGGGERHGEMSDAPPLVNLQGLGEDPRTGHGSRPANGLVDGGLTAAASSGADALDQPLDVVAAFGGVREAWAEIVPAGQGTIDQFDDVQRDLHTLQQLLDAAIRIAPPAAEDAAARAVPVATSRGAEQDGMTPPDDLPREPEDAVNRALRQADAYAPLFEDLPEWQRIQTVRGSYGHLCRS